MERCKLRVRVPGFASTTKHEYERCLADGMWFAAGELEDVMARLHCSRTTRTDL
ncbi:MAG: hypothetical protein ABI867_03575 [Kofleriaceae bacterium]